MVSISFAGRGLTLSLAALVVALLLAVAGGVVPVAAVSNSSDAAHACQQSGYTTLQGTDGTLFKNVGDCVAFVARGGTITGVSAGCTYTAGSTGCIEFNAVVVPMIGGGTTTTLAGMFSFPAADWPLWVYGSGNAAGITGSGTWTASTGATGTWTASHTSSIYAGRFYNYNGSTTTSTPALCGAANTRYVGAHFDVYSSTNLIVPIGALELQVRDATYGIDFVEYQGFTTSPSGEPWGPHVTSNVSGVTVRC